jgi:hypothetical protein
MSHPFKRPPGTTTVGVRYLDIADERWIAPLGTPDPEIQVPGFPLGRVSDPRWIKAEGRRMTLLADGTARVDFDELVNWPRETT